MRYVLAVLIAVFTCGFFACTRATPQIEYWYTKLVYQDTDNGITPSLSFFVMASDEDGPEDLEELRLYSDAQGLMWSVNSSNWILVTDNGKTWIGSKMFRAPEGESFPSGEYRAAVIDKAGEQGEKRFGFDVPDKSPYNFPTLKIEDNTYTITSQYPDNYIMMFYADGTYKSTTKMSNFSGSLDSLRIPVDVYSIALWGDDKSLQIAALTKPVSVRELPTQEEEQQAEPQSNDTTNPQPAP